MHGGAERSNEVPPHPETIRSSHAHVPPGVHEHGWLEGAARRDRTAQSPRTHRRQTLPADPAPTNNPFVVSRLIAGATDGHVYAVDMSSPGLDPKERISHSTP